MPDAGLCFDQTRTIGPSCRRLPLPPKSSLAFRVLTPNKDGLPSAKGGGGPEPIEEAKEWDPESGKGEGGRRAQAKEGETAGFAGKKAAARYRPEETQRVFG